MIMVMIKEGEKTGELEVVEMVIMMIMIIIVIILVMLKP